MKRSTVFGVLAVSVSVSAILTAPVAAQGEAARVDSLFAEWNSLDRPGAAVAVLKDGEIVLERGYGSAQLEHAIPITPATVFHVASVTKQFTAFGVALLAQRGALSLDDDIRKHLPYVPELGHRVTVRQLIHHTSGIRDQWELLAMGGWRLDDVITKDHIVAMMRRQQELNFEPGSEHLYSNMGYTLLAEIVERVGGKPFPEWMRENVFAPLGMTSTHMHDDHEHIVPGRAYSYRRGEDGEWRNAVLSYANAGATSMFTTAGDLARWLGNFETGQVGGTALVEQMRERAVLNNGDTISYAYAIVRGDQRGHTSWSHGGADAGFRSIALHFPEQRLGVVVLSNEASFNPGRLAAAVADIYLGDEPVVATSGEETPADAVPVTVPARLLDEYAGRYDVPGIGILRLIRQGGGLIADAGGRRIPLVAESDSTFRAEAVGARIRIVREAGEVTGMVVTGGGEETQGRRLAPPQLDAAGLAEFAGTYYSPEIETVYRVVVTGDTLVATHQRHGEIPLTVVEPDTFSGGRWYFGRVQFTRTDGGAIDGFRLTGGRVRNLRFVRLTDEALPAR